MEGGGEDLQVGGPYLEVVQAPLADVQLTFLTSLLSRRMVLLEALFLLIPPEEYLHV